jgi:hypothetical protein
MLLTFRKPEEHRLAAWTLAQAGFTSREFNPERIGSLKRETLTHARNVAREVAAFE